jgi:prevent-host-death family protein
MKTVGAFEAKTHLTALLRRVSLGETIQITRRGIPVAKLVPPGDDEKKDVGRTVRELRQARSALKLRGLKIRELIDEGRRY